MKLTGTLFSSSVNSIQSLSRVWLFATPWITAHQTSLSITNSQSSLKVMCIESVMSSSHLILCRPLLLLPQSLPASGSFPISQLFASGGQVLEFQLQHQSFQWIPRTELLYDGLVGSPCSPRDSQESSPTPQFKSINFSALSLLYGPTLTFIHDYRKNHSFDYDYDYGLWTFVSKVMSLLFNMLSRLVITFLPKSKHLLISWLQSPSV